MFTRPETVARFFYTIITSGIIIYSLLAFHIAYKVLIQRSSVNTGTKISYKNVSYDTNLKYILWWTTENANIINDEGNILLLKQKCTHKNCYLTTNKVLLNGDHTNFHAIVFDISVVKEMKKLDFPKSRSFQQKFVFDSMEPSAEDPICNVHMDNYFNWTWSYKLYSDIFNPFIGVDDLKGNKIAPNTEVKWISDKTYFTKKQAAEYVTKTKAVVWIMEKCDGNIEIFKFATKLKLALKAHSLVLDIYECDWKKCKDVDPDCNEIIENEYFFYLAHEGSFSEDFVSKVVLKAYNHKAVPIVIGGADYSKFLPHGSYVNALDFSMESLAAVINYAIKNPAVYISFFRWRKYYTINAVNDYAGICDLCRDLNDPEKFTRLSSYETFRKWWYYGSLEAKCLPKSAEKYNEILSYLKNRY